MCIWLSGESTMSRGLELLAPPLISSEGRGNLSPMASDVMRPPWNPRRIGFGVGKPEYFCVSPCQAANSMGTEVPLFRTLFFISLYPAVDFFFYIVIYLAAPDLSCGMVGSSSLTRDQIRAPCSGSRGLNTAPPREVPTTLFFFFWELKQFL